MNNNSLDHKVYRVLIWGAGRAYSNNIVLLKQAELNGDITIDGITSNDRYVTSIDGIKFIRKEDIIQEQYDVVVLMLERVNRWMARPEINELLGDIVIVNGDVLNVLGFSFDKYVKLYRSKLSVMASTCWGAIVCNKLGLPFLTPLVNLNMSNQDYFKLMNNPNKYLNAEFNQVGTGYNEVDCFHYPIGGLKDIRINFVHYRNYTDAVEKWKERVERINWDNVLVSTYTDDVKVAEEFERLPYDKKFCFVSFETDLPSCYSIKVDNYHTENEKKILSDMYFEAVTGRYTLFDIWDLVLYGKMTDRSVQV